MSGNAKRNLVVGHHGGAGVRGGGAELEILRDRRPVQQAEETGTKILGRGHAGLRSGTGQTLAEDTVYAGDDYFASARLTRQQARDSAISLLEDAAKQEDADQRGGKSGVGEHSGAGVLHAEGSPD